MSPVFKIAWRNVLRNWRHSVASMLSITAGFMAICLFQGFITDAEELFADGLEHMAMLGHVIVQKKGAPEHWKEDYWKYALRAEDQAYIDGFLQSEARRVAARVRFLTVSGLVSNGRTNTVFIGYGYDVEEGARIRGPSWAWNTIAGKPLHLAGVADGILPARTLGVMLDCARTSDEKAFEPGTGYIPKERPFKCFSDSLQLQATTEGSQLNALDATVVGLGDSGLRELDDKWMVMPLETAQRLLDTDTVSMYSVQLHDPAEEQDFATRLMAGAQAKGLELEAQPWKQHALHGEMYRRTVELLGLFQRFVLMVVTIIGAMSVVNTLSKSVAERTREIGTLRSIGYRRGHIVAMFAFEGFLLALVGCGLGIVLSVISSQLVNSAGYTYPAGMGSYEMRVGIRFVPAAYLATTAGLCLICTLAALWPARRAARMKLTDALGHL